MTAGAVLVFVAVALPLLAFMAWVLWSLWTIRIGPRQAGLVIRRGRATTTTLGAGTHFLPSFRGIVEAYPDYEMTYMTLATDIEAMSGRGDADFVDPLFGIIDLEGTGADISYTIRFRIAHGELKQIHERFGPNGIKGIIRDESRRVIQETITESTHTILGLIGPSRVELERALFERIKDALAGNGFTLVLFTVQEPDLRDLGQALQLQRQAREQLTIQELRLKSDEAQHRRLQERSRVRAQIESERTKLRAAADAEALSVRTQAELAAEEERRIRRALIAAKAQEIEIAKQLELAPLEAELRLQRAVALARSGKALEQGVSESLVRLESIASWREVMEHAGGRFWPTPMAGGFAAAPTFPAGPDDASPAEREPESKRSE